MTMRRTIYTILSVGEILFATYAMTQPAGYQYYEFLIGAVWNLTTFLVLMVLLSATFIIFFLRKRAVKGMGVVAIVLSAQWLMLMLSLILQSRYSVVFPLYITMFALRMVTAIDLIGRSEANAEL
jgi:hypothetical protein